MDNLKRVHEIRAIHWKLGVDLEKAKCIFYTNYNDVLAHDFFVKLVKCWYIEYMEATQGKVAKEKEVTTKATIDIPSNWIRLDGRW